MGTIQISPPHRTGQKIDNEDSRSLRMFFDTSETRSLPVGKYRWSFPVFVPVKLPAYNVFVLTICGEVTSAANNVTCGDPRGPRTLVSFPLPGFNHGDVGTGEDLTTAQTGLSRRQASSG